MKPLSTLDKKRVRGYLIRLGLALVWFALVYWLPPKWSNLVAMLGIVGYIIRMNSQDYERPKWGSYFLGAPSDRYEFKPTGVVLDEATKQRLLALLEADNINQVTRSQWQKFYMVLYRRVHYPGLQHSDEVVLALLEALRRHGNTLQLPFPGAWIDKIAYLWARETGHVAEAAQACLPILQARLKNKANSLVLLRPAEGGMVPGQLLRPASGVGETDDQELLRGSALENESGRK